MEKSFSCEILLVEDNPDDRDLFGEYLAEAPFAKFNLTSCASLAEARQKLSSVSFDVIVIDLGLPDSQGLATFECLHALAPKTPALILTGLHDEELSREAVRQGAQDYLFKGQFNGALLVRTIRYAIERQQHEKALREAEDFYRNMLSSISDAVFLTDQAGNFLFISSNAEIIFGYSVSEIQKMGNISALLGEELFDPAALETAEEISNIERLIHDRGGKPHTLLINVKAVSLKGGGCFTRAVTSATGKSWSGKSRRAKYAFGILLSRPRWASPM